MDTPVIQSEAQSPTATGNTPVEKQYDVPKMVSFSQAKRVARFLFGPLVRIRHDFPNGKMSVEVNVERDGEKLSVLSFDQPTFRDALQVALDTVRGAQEKKGKVPQGVMPQMSLNITSVIRGHLVMAMAGADETTLKAVDKLHPNEVLEFNKNARVYALVNEHGDEELKASVLPGIKSDLDFLLGNAAGRRERHSHPAIPVPEKKTDAERQVIRERRKKDRMAKKAAHAARRAARG